MDCELVRGRGSSEPVWKTDRKLGVRGGGWGEGPGGGGAGARPAGSRGEGGVERDRTGGACRLWGSGILLDLEDDRTTTWTGHW